MTGPTTMDQQFLKKLTAVIDANLQNEDFGVAELATELGMSRVTLHRKVKAVIKKSVSEFIREIRLERAYDLLREKTGTVSEISYSVGFSSPNYFIKCFHDFYGITPGDVLKGITVVSEEKPEKKWVITKKQVQFYSASLFILLVILSIYFFVPPHLFINSDKEKIVIVVPPFHSESGKKELNILRSELHNRLVKIKEIVIISEQTSEDSLYRTMNNMEIGKALKADYVLSCKRKIAEGEAKIYLQLVDTKKGRIRWSDSVFEEEKNIWDFSSDVTLSVASDLKIELTEDEKKEITKKPSENPYALNMYQAGLNEIENTSMGVGSYKKAKYLFEQAIKSDSTMAESYVLLSHIYMNLMAFLEADMNKKRSYMDSSKIMAEKALVYDSQNAWANNLIANYNRSIGNIEEAKKYENAAKENAPITTPGHYNGMVSKYHNSGEHAQAVAAGLKYIELLPADKNPQVKTLELIWYNFTIMGFPEIGKKYIDLHYEQTPNNKMLRLSYLAMHERFQGNFEGDIKYTLEKIALQEKWFVLYCDLIFAKMCLKDFDEIYEYVNTINEIKKTKNITRITSQELNCGFACMESGKEEEAMIYFQHFIESFKLKIKNNEPLKYEHNMYLASIYFALNETENAFTCLNELKKAKSNFGWLMFGLRYYPSFDSYRDSPEFKEVFNYVEKEYQKEHERIKKMLKQQGLNPV